MSEKIDTRVSPALDPETFRLIEGHDEETAPFVGDVINTYVDIHHALGKLHDSRELAESNGALTPEGRILIVGKEAAVQRERLTSRLARTERDLRARIAHTEGELSRPLTERAGMGTLNAEVRAHVKSLKRPEREAFMREAMERDDVPTLEAVLGGQFYLSGFTKIDHEYYVRTYHERKNPHLVKRLDVMNRFLDLLERSVPILPLQFDKAVGAKPKLVEAIRAADDKMHAALKIEPV